MIQDSEPSLMLARVTTGVCRLPSIAAVEARLIWSRETRGLFTTESACEGESRRGVDTPGGEVGRFRGRPWR